jgi:hypothetical protein
MLFRLQPGAEKHGATRLKAALQTQGAQNCPVRVNES